MTLRDWPLRLRALIAPRRVERELDEELAFHLEHEAEKLIAGGMSPGEAGRTARARFGPVALAADQCRDQRARLVDRRDGARQSVRAVHVEARADSRRDRRSRDGDRPRRGCAVAVACATRSAADFRGPRAGPELSACGVRRGPTPKFWMPLPDAASTRCGRRSSV